MHVTFPQPVTETRDEQEKSQLRGKLSFFLPAWCSVAFSLAAKRLRGTPLFPPSPLPLPPPSLAHPAVSGARLSTSSQKRSNTNTHIFWRRLFKALLVSLLQPSSTAACEHQGEGSKLRQGDGHGARQEHLAQKTTKVIRFRVALEEPTVPEPCQVEGTSAFEVLTPG